MIPEDDWQMVTSPRLGARKAFVVIVILGFEGHTKQRVRVNASS